MKKEWRKEEKNLYLPKNKPVVIEVPEFKFLTIEGEGRPGSEYFAGCIEVLYSLSYGIKMGLKKREVQPPGYCDYAVYPLEGIWDLNEKGRAEYDGTFDKNDLVYKLMIRQPDFIDEALFREFYEITAKKKPHALLDRVGFESICDGKSVQMLHLGSYDDEPESFRIMEEFAEEQNLKRKTKVHREIYLSDFRKTEEDKLKTVLRFQV